MTSREIHQYAIVIAQDNLDLVKPLLREKEYATAFEEFFQIARRWLLSLNVQHARTLERLRPMSN